MSNGCPAAGGLQISDYYCTPLGDGLEVAAGKHSALLEVSCSGGS